MVELHALHGEGVGARLLVLQDPRLVERLVRGTKTDLSLTTFESFHGCWNDGNVDRSNCSDLLRDCLEVVFVVFLIVWN